MEKPQTQCSHKLTLFPEERKVCLQMFIYFTNEGYRRHYIQNVYKDKPLFTLIYWDMLISWNVLISLYTKKMTSEHKQWGIEGSVPRWSQWPQSNHSEWKVCIMWENLNKDTYKAAEKYLLLVQLEPLNPGLQKQTLPLCVRWQKTAPPPLCTSSLNGNLSWLSMQLGPQPEWHRHILQWLLVVRLLKTEYRQTEWHSFNYQLSQILAVYIPHAC
jgi:hypothetical protein